MLVDTAPHTPLGVTPSSAILSRLLNGCRPGNGILTRLPSELIQSIATHLPMPALGHLRLTCKELESKILWHFAKTYFREMKFMHSKYALDALVAMSNSRMAKYVRTLALGPPSNDQGIVFFGGGNAPKTPSRRQRIMSAMYNYAAENRTMRAFGHDAAMIQTALGNLPAVTKLEFLGPKQECACPFCTPTNSYGERHLVEAIGEGKAGFAPIVLDASQSIPRLMHIALEAAQSVGLQLECIDARTTHFPDEYVEECQKTGFGSYSLTFPSAPVRVGSLDSAFATLSSLKLYLGHHQDTCNSDRRLQLVQSLTAFFGRAPALRTLGLMFQEGHGTLACLEQLTSSPSLRKILRLELRNFEFSSMELFDVLDPLAKTLQELDLSFFKVDDWFAMLFWFRYHMTSLTKVALHELRGFPSSARYTGDSIAEFFEETATQWQMDRDAAYEYGYNTDDSSI
jgi:hypothetical protein